METNLIVCRACIIRKKNLPKKLESFADALASQNARAVKPRTEMCEIEVHVRGS